mmetsp:Transcript_17015/g.39717  ORF Transcript_17015/g.39717 Transcript_17015/m.39717 type:complete len:216 (+) Transcript_17015:362-1009(+)
MASLNESAVSSARSKTIMKPMRFLVNVLSASVPSGFLLNAAKGRFRAFISCSFSFCDFASGLQIGLVLRNLSIGKSRATLSLTHSSGQSQTPPSLPSAEGSPTAPLFFFSFTVYSRPNIALIAGRHCNLPLYFSSLKSAVAFCSLESTTTLAPFFIFGARSASLVGTSTSSGPRSDAGVSSISQKIGRCLSPWAVSSVTRALQWNTACRSVLMCL